LRGVDNKRVRNQPLRRIEPQGRILEVTKASDNLNRNPSKVLATKKGSLFLVVGSIFRVFWGEDPSQTGSVFAVYWHYGRKKPVEKEML